MKTPCPLLRERSLTLRPGAVHREWLAAGTLLVVQEGAVHLDGPPDWLADGLYVSRERLGEGCAARLPRAGWVRIGAEAPAMLRVVTPEPGGVTRAVAAAWRMLARTFAATLRRRKASAPPSFG